MKILNSREPNQAWGLFNVSLEARRRRRRPTSSCGRSTASSPRAIKRDEYQGLRVTPNVYTTLDEVDTFAAAIEELLKNPSATA